MNNLNGASFLYAANFTLLAVHEMDSVYWQEWKLFRLPGGAEFFLALHVLLIPLILYGFVKLLSGDRSGYVFSLVVAGAGLFGFGIHTMFILTGHPEFRSAFSLILLGLMLAVSVIQLTV